jgi:hypothetical protein
MVRQRVRCCPSMSKGVDARHVDPGWPPVASNERQPLDLTGAPPGAAGRGGFRLASLEGVIQRI